MASSGLLGRGRGICTRRARCPCPGAPRRRSSATVVVPARTEPTAIRQGPRVRRTGCRGRGADRRRRQRLRISARRASQLRIDLVTQRTHEHTRRRRRRRGGRHRTLRWCGSPRWWSPPPHGSGRPPRPASLAATSVSSLDRVHTPRLRMPGHGAMLAGAHRRRPPPPFATTSRRRWRTLQRPSPPDQSRPPQSPERAPKAAPARPEPSH